MNKMDSYQRLVILAGMTIATIAAVGANQRVYITQVGGVTTSRKDANGEIWVEVDLQRTFGRNFGISPSFGWLSNTEPSDRRSTLVNGCS